MIRFKVKADQAVSIITVYHQWDIENPEQVKKWEDLTSNDQNVYVKFNEKH